MMQKLKKSLSAIVITSFVFAMAISVSPAFAQDDTFWGNLKPETQNALGLGDTDQAPQVIAARLVNIMLGFLGIIAVVIILLGGFKWMTAGGNEDKIGEAKGLLSAGVIGLIIILMSWALATWVISILYNATGLT